MIRDQNTLDFKSLNMRKGVWSARFSFQVDEKSLLDDLRNQSSRLTPDIHPNTQATYLSRVLTFRSSAVASMIIGLLISFSAEARPPSWLETETLHMHRNAVRYIQRDFGFSVAAPDNIPMYITNGGDANYGVRMILGDYRVIDVFPEFILEDVGNMIPCKSAKSAWEKNSKEEIAFILLGGEAACSETYRQGGNIEMVIQQKRNYKGQDIMYTAVLHTNERHAHSDIKSFSKVASNFKQEN